MNWSFDSFFLGLATGCLFILLFVIVPYAATRDVNKGPRCQCCKW